MIAKYVSICEWRMANLIIDEYYCEEIAKLMRRSVQRIVENAGKLSSRDPQVIQAIIEGLVLSGVAMSFAGTSRPASGLEHYFSHMWEMMAGERHTHADLHGIQVGVGTLETLKLYDWIKTLTPDRDKAMARPWKPSTRKSGPRWSIAFSAPPRPRFWPLRKRSARTTRQAPPAPGPDRGALG